MRKHHVSARKYFIEKYNLDLNATYIEIAKKVIEESNGTILFDNYTKESAAQFLYIIKVKHEIN